jgi:sporulation protein YlmC with PRC-barrel domain
VGDIVDFALNLDDPPRLRYVLASTGGLLDLGGDVRAIPAGALTVNDDHVSFQLTKADYEKQKVLPDDRIAYLNTDDHQQAIDRHFNVKADAKAKTSAGAVRRDDKNALGTLVLFSKIENKSAVTSDGKEIGRIVDVWMNAKDNRVPYVEVRPAARMGPESPFSAGGDRNYAIPAAKITNRHGDGGYAFDVTRDSLKQAERVNAQSGVEMVQGGGAADTVLMVSVPSVSVTTSRRQSADSTTRSRQQTADDANSRSGSPSFERDAARADRPLARSAHDGVVRVSDEIEVAPDDVSESTVRHYAGQDVHSPDGNKLGSIDDFMIDATSGRIAWAGVSSGRVGSGDERAVPGSAVNAPEEGCSVNIQVGQWTQAPTGA